MVLVGCIGAERCIAGVHEPRLGTDGSVEVETPGTGHQQF